MASSISRFICSICLEDFTKPKLIDCHHTFCEKCLADHIRNFSLNNQFPCPLCRRDIFIPETGVSGFSSNFYLEDIIITTSPTPAISKCDPCNFSETKRDAAYKCKDCNQFMCGDCKSKHDSFSGCLNHYVFTLEEVNLSADRNHDIAEKSYCPRHANEILEFFCYDCQTTLCYKCAATIHNGHRVQDVDDKVKLQGTQEMEKLKHDMEYVKKKLDEHVDGLVFGMSTLKTSTFASSQQIDLQTENICKQARLMGEQLKTEIRNTNYESEQVLGKLLAEHKKKMLDLERSLHEISQVLKLDSAVCLFNKLPKLRQELFEVSHHEFLVPERKKVTFNKRLVNAETMFQVIGNLDYRDIGEFQSTFNLDEVEGNELGWSSQEFIIRNKICCSVSIQNKSGYCSATVCMNRNPNTGDGYPHEMLSNIHCSILLELVNCDMSKSLITRIDQQPSTEAHCMHFFNWPDVINWKSLSNSQAGFIDTNKNVIFRVTVLYKKK